jgi:hypothetical protein
MNAIYKDIKTGKRLTCPIVCAALVELEDGSREVKLMDVNAGDGAVGFFDRMGNFQYISYREAGKESGDMLF